MCKEIVVNLSLFTYNAFITRIEWNIAITFEQLPTEWSLHIRKKLHKRMKLSLQERRNKIKMCKERELRIERIKVESNIGWNFISFFSTALSLSSSSSHSEMKIKLWGTQMIQRRKRKKFFVRRQIKLYHFIPFLSLFHYLWMLLLILLLYNLRIAGKKERPRLLAVICRYQKCLFFCKQNEWRNEWKRQNEIFLLYW